MCLTATPGLMSDTTSSATPVENSTTGAVVLAPGVRQGDEEVQILDVRTIKKRKVESSKGGRSESCLQVPSRSSPRSSLTLIHPAGFVRGRRDHGG